MAIINTYVTRNTQRVARKGFDGLCFIGSHRWFKERIRKYEDKGSVLDDVPSDSPEYAAATAHFSQSPAPKSFYLGRRESAMVVAPQSVAAGSDHVFTIYVNDGHSALINYEAANGETAESVVDAVKTAIDSDATVSSAITATKNGSGAGTTLTLEVRSSDDTFWVKNISGMTYQFTTSESAVDVKSAIEEENDGAYAYASSDHSQAFALAMAAAVEGTESMYFYGSQEAASVTEAYSETSTDTLARLVQGNYFNTAPVWSHTADTDFFEVAYFSSNAVYTPGEVTYVNYPMAGFEIARGPSGNYLSATERANLAARNTSFITLDKSLGAVVTGGTVAGGGSGTGEWIDVMVFSHYWADLCRVALGLYIVNLKGSKFAGQAGLNATKSILNSTTNRLVSDNQRARGLRSYTWNIPANDEITTQDRADRKLKISCNGKVEGAFHHTDIFLNLEY